MKLEKHVIFGIGKPFDGLIVSVSKDEILEGESDLLRIHRIESSSHLFESFSIPLSEGLYISIDQIEAYKEPEETQLTDNLYGKHIQDYRLHLKDKVILAYSVFEKATTVRIEQDQTVLYAHVFLGDGRPMKATNYLTRCKTNDDPSSVIFDLQEME